jgi:hypothetical protein
MGTHRSWKHLQRSYFCRATQDTVGHLKDLAVAGLQHMVLCPLDDALEQLDMYASEIVPYFRTAGC